MTLLEKIRNPRDLKALRPEELPQLAAEIRDVLIETVSRNGGHLGPNLGVVELTIALHRVFDSPADRIVFDTGHQSYVHKLLTGRTGGFDAAAPARRRLRVPEPGGVRARLRGELARFDEPVLRRRSRQGDVAARRRQHRVVAVIGDGALTGGMAWEALNNIAGAKDRRVVIVVNDNGRSYQRTIGGLADHLATVRVSQRYEQVLELHQDHVVARAAVRPAAVRDAARDQEGH